MWRGWGRGNRGRRGEEGEDTNDRARDGVEEKREGGKILGREGRRERYACIKRFKFLGLLSCQFWLNTVPMSDRPSHTTEVIPGVYSVRQTSGAKDS